MVRVLYQVLDLKALQDVWLDAAEQLQPLLGWTPVYWVTLDDEDERKVHARFSDVVTHPKVDAIRGIPPSSLEGVSPATLDEEVIKRFAKYEPTFCSMMDRAEGPRHLPYRQRRRVFRKQLAWWLGAWEVLRPDVVVFQSSPHSLFDYVIYAIAMETGTMVRMFEQTSVLGYMYAKASIEQIPERLLDAYAACLDDVSEAPEHITEYLDQMRGDYEQAKPWYMKPAAGAGSANGRKGMVGRLGRALARPHLWPKYAFNITRDVARNAINTAPVGGRRPPADSRAQILQGRLSMYRDGMMTEKDWRRYQAEARDYRAKLRFSYEQRSVQPDMQRDFVYFPLHYQPERTTCPDGGLFEDQYLVATMIARTLPEGWRLYVREHPSQFADFPFFGEQGRYPHFYEDLLEIGNVVLVDITANPFDLIDRARAVATVTGTAGWEAVVRGKPSLVFGNAWYAACKSVWRISNKCDLEEALQRVEAGWLPNRDEVTAYAMAIERVGVLGDINCTLPPNVRPSHERRVQALVDGLTMSL